MTQNKKKGIAKKALSISLVAAMLATSNVPVWASGFEAVDPAAEGFAVEEAVEVVEETTTLNTSVNNGSINANVTLPSNSEWAHIITPTGSITKEDGSYLGGWNYIWKVDGQECPAGMGNTNASGSVTGVDETNFEAKMAEMAYAPGEELIGKTIELCIVRNDSSADINMVVGSVNVTEQTINNGKLVVNDTYEYDGKAKTSVEDFEVYITEDATAPLDSEYFNVTTNGAVNAGEDVLEVTVSAKPGSPYSGSVKTTVDIETRTYEEGDLVVTLKEGLSYEFTGKDIVVDKSNVTVATSEELGSVDVTSAVKKVTVDGTAAAKVGDYSVAVRFDADKLSNFDTLPEYIFSTETVKVVPRDLSKTTITIAEVEKGSAISANDITIKSGNEVLALQTPGDYIAEVKDPQGNPVPGVCTEEGIYTAEFKKGTSGNATGTQKVTFRVVANVIKNVSWSKAIADKDYTGKAIEPGTAELGSLTIDGTAIDNSWWKIVGYENNIDASTVETGKAKVVVELLDGKYKGKTCTAEFTILPLTVKPETVTVPKTVTYDKQNKKASDYEVPVVVVAKDSKGKNPVTLSADDYKVTYKFVNAQGNDQNVVNEPGSYIQTSVEITDKNFVGSADPVIAEKKTKIVNRALEDSFIKIDPTSYEYTGGKIVPEYTVMDGSLELEKDVDYKEVGVVNGVNAGTATLTIAGVAGGSYDVDSTASATFTITPVSVDKVDVVVTGKDTYTGKKVRPTYKVMLGENDVTSQFELVSYGENINAGEDAGTITIAPEKGNTNFTGTSKTDTFTIKPAKVSGNIKVYDEYGKELATLPDFKYDGTAKTFASEKFVITNDTTKTATAEDFEIKYVDNVYGPTGYVYAVAKAGSNFTGNETIKTADGTVIKGVVAKKEFGFTNVVIKEANVSVSNGTYAEGLVVKPNVLVQVGGRTLVEGKDYTLSNYGDETEVNNGKMEYSVTIKGKGGYDTEPASGITLTRSWGIDKKDLSDCTVRVENGNIVVMNGNIEVPASKLDITQNEDGSYTIKPSKEGSKYYSGTTTAEGVNTPDATVLSVTDRTTSTVSLKWDEVEGAEGYTIWFRSEYDTEMSRKIIKGGDVTSWKQTGLQPGTKYFYGMRSWVKDANGKYVFSEVSPTQRGTTKPAAAVVTGVSADNGYVKVRLAGEAAGAEKYSMCYSKTMNGFDNDNFKVGIRTSYTVRTFKDALDAGTYYVRVKSYRDLGNNKRVYGAWSNAMKVVVK